MYMALFHKFLHFASKNTSFCAKTRKISNDFPLLILISRSFDAKAVPLQPFCRKVRLLT